jgi:hypothetical protein
VGTANFYVQVRIANGGAYLFPWTAGGKNAVGSGKWYPPSYRKPCRHTKKVLLGHSNIGESLREPFLKNIYRHRTSSVRAKDEYFWVFFSKSDKPFSEPVTCCFFSEYFNHDFTLSDIINFKLQN